MVISAGKRSVPHLLCFLVGAVHFGEEKSPQFVLEGGNHYPFTTISFP